MKKIVALIMLSALATSCTAQKETFDLVSYSPPSGWKKDQKEGYVVYSTTQQNSYCLIAIYKSAAGSNNITTDFASEWQHLAATPYHITAQPNLQEVEQDNGWVSQTGGATFSNDGGNNILLLATSSGYNKVLSIMIITNDTSYMSSVGSFSASVTLKKPAVNEITNKPSTVLAGEKAAVWMNIQSNALYGGGGYWSFTDPNRVKFYVVYPDGDYCSEMPYAGLQTFDKTRSKSSGERSWGKFTMANNSGSFISQYENIKLKKISATKMEKQGYTYPFYKCGPVDGLHFNGGWSSIPNWTKDPYYSQAGCRRVIYFTPDGHFDDRGIFVSDSRYPNRHPEDAPGKGVYSISNFTLVLRYDDGRVIYKAFTGVADRDPAINDEVIYIGTNPFYKK